MLSLPAALVAMAITSSGPGDPVLLDFYADWCGPCRSMMPTVEQLAAKGYPVRRVNVDQYPDLARRFGITNIPCFVMVVNGQEAGRVVGPTSLGRLEQLCSRAASAPNPNTMLAMPARAAPPGNASLSAGGASSAPVAPAVCAVPTEQRRPASDAEMLATCVRLRVEDPQGISCGSGTIVDARSGGEALVLTCGHLFRDSQGKGTIDVDVYGPSPSARVPGRLLAYDLERDVALVAFTPRGPVTVARIAPPDYSIRPGDAVTSAGCNKGDDPTLQHSRVNALDRFLDSAAQRGGSAAGSHGPWNVEVAGEPVVGRSGGGLFSADGMVIGVCNAAEPAADQEGLFAGLGSIHAALDHENLASLYRQRVAPPTLVPFPERAAASLVAVDPFSAARKSEPPVQNSSPAPLGGPSDSASAASPAVTIAAATASPAASSTPADSAALAGGEKAVLERIRHSADEGSEVVCIIRDRNDPQAKSQVITLDRASPAFVNELSSTADPRNRPHETSLEVPKRPAPILEWDIQTGWKHQGPLP